MSPKRRLAPILPADVVGYSRLMGVDEVATLQAHPWLIRRLSCSRADVPPTRLLGPNPGVRHRGAQAIIIDR
jgi:hypothetical protein